MQPITDIDVVVFDVLGTLVDEPAGIRAAIHQAVPDANSAQMRTLVEHWQEHIAHQQNEIAAGRRDFAGSELLEAAATRAVLDAAATLQLQPAPDAVARLATASRQLPPWPDSVTQLERIAEELPVLALSNAAPTTLLHLAASTGLRWHQAVSADSVEAYKPAPELYRRAIEVADALPSRTLMVAAHAWDLRAAQTAGMRTCYVERPVGDPPTASDRFDATVRGLNELVVR